MMTARTVVELSALAPSPPGVEVCSCDEAIALRRQLAATTALAKASRALPRKDLEWWATHAGPTWKTFARAVLALPGEPATTPSDCGCIAGLTPTGECNNGSRCPQAAVGRGDD